MTSLASSRARPGPVRLKFSMLENVQLCKLFVGGLSPHTSDVGLRKHFEAFGRLMDCAVVMNPRSNRSRCFGFITFSSMAEADAAMAASPHIVDGNRVELKRAVSREDSGRPGAHARVKKIFVGGLKGDVGESDLVKHFSQFGPVERAEIIVNKQTGKKRGFGFVHFLDHDSADKAAVIKFHPIQGHRVEVKKALPKEDLDQWNFDLPALASSSWTWRPSYRVPAGYISSPSPIPRSTPDPSPAPIPIPTPLLTPVLKPSGWRVPKLSGWLGPQLPGWLGPESDEDVHPQPSGDPAPKSNVLLVSQLVGDSDATPARGPNPRAEGDLDPQVDRAHIPSFVWLSGSKPAWTPSPLPGCGPNQKPGWGPNQKPGWDPDPKPVEGPSSTPVGGFDPNPVGGFDPKPREVSYAPEFNLGATSAPKLVLRSRPGTGFKPGFGKKPYPDLNLGYSPKPGQGPNTGFSPKPGPGPNPGPPGLGPNLGFGLGSGPRRLVSRGIRDQNDRGRNYSSYGGYGRVMDYRSSYSHSHSQYGTSFGPMKRRWGGWVNWGDPTY